MHWTQTPPFATQRRVTGSVEYWMYLAAAYVYNATEEVCRAVAEIAMREKCGIWHATWIYRGRQPGPYACGCANCLPRGAKSVVYDDAPIT